MLTTVRDFKDIVRNFENVEKSEEPQEEEIAGIRLTKQYSFTHQDERIEVYSTFKRQFKDSEIDQVIREKTDALTNILILSVPNGAGIEIHKAIFCLRRIEGVPSNNFRHEYVYYDLNMKDLKTLDIDKFKYQNEF